MISLVSLIRFVIDFELKKKNNYSSTTLYRPVSYSFLITNKFLLKGYFVCKIIIIIFILLKICNTVTGVTGH